MVCSPIAKLVPLATVLVTLSTPQLSLVAGASQLTVVAGPVGGALTVMAAGQVMVGLPVSCTVTVKVQTASLPASSVAVTVIYIPRHECRREVQIMFEQPTVVDVPTLNVFPEDSLYTMPTVVSALSVAVAAGHVTARLAALVLTTTLAGQLKTGSSASDTLMLKLHEALLLLASVAM